KVSRADPEAGYMVREGKPKGFFYLDHRTVDGRCGIDIRSRHQFPKRNQSAKQNPAENRRGSSAV
ncbi:hypothetical protein, partial [Mesorhizobium sp.]|uniref:hypothetical protein n=1 Tax=Mesorhizobium sp. TaxID=1871066 RepID=UPI000FE9BCF8